MSSKINAISTGVGGLATSADASGILEIQTNDTTAITVDGSQNVAFAGTVTGLPAQLGQTWTNVTASRTRSVIYTNTTGAAIQVSITAQNINGVVMFLIINGQQASRAYGAATTMEVSVSGIVPNGSSYYMINSASGTIHLWSELR